MATNIGKKIEDYASKNLQALKQEEAKTGKKFTKYDIALFMLSKGELNKSDFASWMNTSEGFASQTLSKQQSQALKQGNVWSFAGYGSGEESYLDSLTPFSQKSDIEKINLLYSPNHGLGIQSTANERENRVKEINEDLSGSRKVNVKKDLQENKIKAHWESLPEVTASYTELMNSIKFKEMSQEEQVEFLLKTAGEKFNEAREKGDKRAMKEYLMQGIGLAFQKLDNETGITKFKDWAKERSGLNTLVEYIDEKVDNNSADLSVAERIWENIKGIGDFADSLAGTQGVAMIGAFMILGEAVAVSATSTLSQAAAAKVLTGFQALLTSYFGIEGGKLVYDGVVENLNASSKEDVRAAGQKLGSGAFMLYGAGKGAKQVYQNVKTMYQASQVQAANQQALADARKTLGLDENVELTEATLKAAKKAMTLKAHPDKGGSVEAMQQVNAAYDLLKASLSTSVNTSYSASASSTVGNSQNVTSNTPVRYTQAQQVNATKTTYQLINNTNSLISYNDINGNSIQVLPVAVGTVVSTPSGYKTVGIEQVVIKTGNTIDVKDAAVVEKDIVSDYSSVSSRPASSLDYYPDVQIGKGVDPHKALIILNSWNNSHGGVKSIEHVIIPDHYDAMQYDRVIFNDGSSREVPSIVDTKVNILNRYQNEVGLDGYTGVGIPRNYKYENYDSALSSLYKESLEDCMKSVYQPSTPVIVDNNKVTTTPNDIDNFFDYKNLKRKDAANIFRFGEETVSNPELINKMTSVLKYDLKIDEPQANQFRSFKRGVLNKDYYVYYDKETNLSVVFDPKGIPMGQVAFNTNCQVEGDQIPTDYKIYSIYMNNDFKTLETNGISVKSDKIPSINPHANIDRVEFVPTGVSSVDGNQTYTKVDVFPKKVAEKKADLVVLNAWNNKNGGIKSIEYRNYDRDVVYYADGTSEAYPFRINLRDITVLEKQHGKKIKGVEHRQPESNVVYFNDGTSKSYPEIVDAQKNILDQFLSYGIGGSDNHVYSIYNSSMQELYGISIKDFAEVVTQPSKPVISQSSISKYHNKNNYVVQERALLAKNVRLGNDSPVDAKVKNTIISTLENKLGIVAPDLNEIKAYDNQGIPGYRYYDKNTNLVTLFDYDGRPKGQISLNTYYNRSVDKLPTDYQIYSLYLEDQFRTFEVGAPQNYRARLSTPDYSNIRSKFPADAYQTATKPGKAIAYTTTYEPDGIVYRGADGKLYVPNKWNPDSPHEVKPNSVIMVYDEAGGDFAVGDPMVIAQTYRNPATNQIDPLYDVAPGTRIEIQKDIVPSAFKILPEGSVVKTKEAPNGVTVKSGQAVMYDIDGDPYVVDIEKTLLKRQEPVDERSKAAFEALKSGNSL